ncbi:MAG TPA: aldehyde ferredoxin oxidoreductase family protein [Dehalococcoidia bacterium]|jgi:aldehyde:ferredoxin oxidoreductase|nr:aldehyde ferredoxin oxidoreductase family protein [Dehalococcoidia bacterium]
MPHGYIGKILRVDLSSGRVTTEEFPENFYRQYLGGEGFTGYFLLKEVPPRVDPLGPDNKLIFAAGPLTGVPVGGCGRHSVGAKSPLTGAFGEAEAGGYWGAELKMAGFDAVIVEGKAEKPVYIFIRDGGAEIRDAAHLWGMRTLECQNTIREELGDPLIKVAQIGPAGEKLVRFACVINDLDAAAGRTGMGAVMGSKKLKAVACRGRQRVSLADPEQVKEIGTWVRDNTPIILKGMHDFGTSRLVPALNSAGGLPTRNFQLGSIDGAEQISGQTMKDTILTRRRACFACAVQCKREVKVDEPYLVDPRYGGPEYETLAALGSDCGITDLKALAKANELANAYGLDTISCGAAIAFAMECFENGLVTAKDTGGVELRFGNAQAMLQMVEEIALRRGFGDVLAEGVARAAQQIGSGAEAFALHIKGQELPMHEPRWKQGMGVGYAISPTGADHCHNIHDIAYTEMTPMLEVMKAVGILEPMPLDDLSAGKVRLLKYYSEFIHLLNCTVCCYFVMSLGLMGFDRLTQLVRAVTGWDTTFFELLKVGERVVNLARVFNLREGFGAEDDSMPSRFFSPHPSGPLKVALDPEAFQKAKEAYYDMMGWPGGVPSPGKLGELGIEWALPLLAQK